MPTENSNLAQLRAAIAALEAQRSTLGEAVVETALGPLRERLLALEARAQPEQQRKLATVLFMDMVGHTALIRDLDPEENMALIDEALARLAEPVGKHGGHVARYQGEGFKAVFGLPTAHENDPENAVRAALAIQEVAAAIAAEWTAARSAGVLPALFQVRVGLDTGLVFSGGLTEGKDTVKGLPVNIAARLESAAAPGAILISHNVYRHVRGVFDVRPREPMAVKGVEELVQTYVVERAKPRAFRLATRGVEGVETRMVGRDNEHGLLREAYLDALDARETHIMTIVGEAGVGKSRLLYEFDNWLELRPEGIFYFKGRATPNTRNVAYSLFRDMFTYRFDILDSDSTAVALDKFRGGMAGVLEPEQRDLVGHWLGFDFSSSEAVQRLLGGAGLADTARMYLTRYLSALTVDNPVVVLFEDLHWADDSSLDLAAYLAAAIPAARLLIVAVTRPSLFERRPKWGEGEAAFRRIQLRPLSNRDSRALVGEILRRVDETPDDLRDLIIDAAEGNPFYVEELVKMLIDQGVIERDAPAEDLRGLPQTSEVWRVRTDKLAALKVPPTLTALLQARLDGLPSPEREALQRASVVGRLFWDDAVADLLQTRRDEVVLTLEAVRGRELIFRRERSTFAGAEEYIFKHALLRDVTYETVLLKRRTAYHGRIARWLEAHAGERLNEYLGLIAEHYVQAGEGVRAAVLLEQAGVEAMRVGAYDAARRTLERALALREGAGELSAPAVMALLIRLGEAYIQLGDYSAAETVLARGLASARRTDDCEIQAEGLVLLAWRARERGDYDRAWDLLAEALPLSRVVGGRVLSLTLYNMGVVAWSVGNITEAEARGMEGLRVARDASDAIAELNVLNLLGIIAYTRRQAEVAMGWYEAELSLARRVGHLFSEVRTLTNMGDVAYITGDYEAARAYGRAGLERSRGLEGAPSSQYLVGNLAQAELKLGDEAAARRGARELLAMARSLGARAQILWGICLFGQILAETGAAAQALALYGLARAQPLLDHHIFLESEEEIGQLGLPAVEVEAGLAVGAALDVETVVQEILDGKW